MTITVQIVTDTPQHLILEHKVYELKVFNAGETGRAFDRLLVDYGVNATNPVIESDNWQTQLGVSRELYEDFPSYKLDIPITWVLFRFLCHHVRTNSIDVLSGRGGQVLLTSNFKEFLGTSQDDSDDILATVLISWIGAFPENPIQLKDIYASTDMPLETLLQSINSLKFQNKIAELSDQSYEVKPLIIAAYSKKGPAVSFDRKSNRYYQEIQIQAVEPFCFVIMPFREEEFPQAIYFDVIKTFIETKFKIQCYRVDEDMLPDRIDNKIYSLMLRSAFVVAEVTTKNPNVMYEIGLAHMLEKACIIVTQTANSDVPFDISRISAKSYSNDDELISYLEESISALAFRKF